MLVEKIFLNNKVEFKIILFENILYFFFIERIFINNILYIKKKKTEFKKDKNKTIFFFFFKIAIRIVTIKKKTTKISV